MKAVKVIAIISAILLPCTLSARRYSASDAAAVARLRLVAGDTLVLKAGVWKDQTVKVKAEGTAEAPIVVEAERPGETVFTGASKLAFSGTHIVVSGLWFKDITGITGEVVSFRTSSSEEASFCTLKECAITGTGAAQDETDYKWVSLYGHDNTMTHCSLIDKNNMGCAVVVWFRTGVVPRDTISCNYFSRPRTILDSTGTSQNGQETIRIGTSEYSLQEGACLVAGNSFYRCNGEVEIISNKSCGNRYTGNLFTECVGTLTLRHGNGCTVDGNSFFGNGVEGTGGIRLIGESHKVYDNYLQGLTGQGFYSAITLVQGEPDSKINGYFAAKHCYVVNNTIYNCHSGLNINHTGSRNKLPIEDDVIACNVIVNDTGDRKAENVKVSATPAPPVDMMCRDNVTFGGKVKAADPSKAGTVEADPCLRRVGDYYVPVKKSYLDRNRVDGFDFVTTDILGQPRKGKTTCGAFETVSRINTRIPSGDTGVTWKLVLK